MVAALEWWSGTECSLYTDPKSFPLYGKENAIVVLNHSFEIDFMCGWTFCDKFGVLGVRESPKGSPPDSTGLFLTRPACALPQSSKVLAKKDLSYVPIIGWMWYFLEIVFCKRKWEEDRKTVVEALHKLHDYPENFWVRLNTGQSDSKTHLVFSEHCVAVWSSQ